MISEALKNVFGSNNQLAAVATRALNLKIITLGRNREVSAGLLGHHAAGGVGQRRAAQGSLGQVAQGNARQRRAAYGSTGQRRAT